MAAARATALARGRIEVGRDRELRRVRAWNAPPLRVSVDQGGRADHAQGDLDGEDVVARRGQVGWVDHQHDLFGPRPRRELRAVGKQPKLGGALLRERQELGRELLAAVE